MDVNQFTQKTSIRIHNLLCFKSFTTVCAYIPTTSILPKNLAQGTCSNLPTKENIIVVNIQESCMLCQRHLTYSAEPILLHLQHLIMKSTKAHVPEILVLFAWLESARLFVF